MCDECVRGCRVWNEMFQRRFREDIYVRKEGR